MTELLITAEQLKEVMPLARSKRIALFAKPLDEAMRSYSITTPSRIAAFIAQLAHESGCFNYVRELASGERYEGRADLGNYHKGDGVRYKGRGLIQITGRSNYHKCGEALGIDFEVWPERLEEPKYATLSAAWFWDRHGLNELADKQAFREITHRINGGYNGWAERVAYYERAKNVFGID